MNEKADTKQGPVFIKDTSFDPKKIDDPFFIEARIPAEHCLKTPQKGLQLANRNELRHAVGIVAARTLKYFSTNGQGINIFRSRGMSVWWLRHLYNSFNWWNAYVVNAEGERKDMPMLYIGEKFGTATSHKDSNADIVLSAFENDRSIVSKTSRGGVVFAVGYSERKGLFNSPDMYGVKTIVGSKYKGAGVNVTLSIRKNLKLMAEHNLNEINKKATSQNINTEISKMKVIVLDRPRHRKLVSTIREVGAKIILVKDDDLTPTLAVVRNKVDLIIGVGGITEAVLSAIIVEKLGGEMSIKLLPAGLVQDERLLKTISSQIVFKKNEVDILKNFKIVKPGTEKKGELPWDKILTSKDLARGKDTVFTASVIKKTPWVKFPDMKNVPGVEIAPETGDIKVYTVRIADDKVEIVPIIYKTVIGKYKEQLAKNKKSSIKAKAVLLLKLSKSYAEFGLFQNAKECLQEIRKLDGRGDELLQRCNAVYEYVEVIDYLANSPVQIPETIIMRLEQISRMDKDDKEGLRPRRMIKRFFEYRGDENYHNRRYEESIAYYKEAIKYSPHELKLYRKVNTIQMRDIIKDYFSKIDDIHSGLDLKEPEDQKMTKLEVGLNVFYKNKKYDDFSCRDPWLIFFRRTVLHGKTPSYKLALLIKLLNLHRKLNRASDDELPVFLKKKFRISAEEAKAILNYRKVNGEFNSVGVLFFIKELALESLSKLLFPSVRVESQNELEDPGIPLSISLVEAMEQRSVNILEEIREGFKEDAQEHQYALAESYHYVGLALYDVGDDEGTKKYYKKSIKHFNTILEKFEGLTLVYAQYRIGELYEELALLFEKNQKDYYKKALDIYTPIVDEREFSKQFGNIQILARSKIEQASARAAYIKDELLK